MTENYSRNPYNRTALIVLLLFSLILQAQSSGTPQSNLKMHLTAHQLINGVPDTFSFVFVKVGDHEVRVPPVSPCMGGRYSGTLILELGGGCGGISYHMPGILEEAKLWSRLQPGESLTKMYKRGELRQIQHIRGTQGWCHP